MLGCPGTGDKARTLIRQALPSPVRSRTQLLWWRLPSWTRASVYILLGSWGKVGVSLIVFCLK